MKNHREIAYLFLRLTMAVIFLFYGIGKFRTGLGEWAADFQERFIEQLPMFLLIPFSYLLPFLEVVLGTLLLLGLFTGGSLIVAAALMLVLTFGAVIEPSPATVANNALLALIVFVLLSLHEYNRYSLDHRRTSKENVPERGPAGKRGPPPPRRRRRRGDGRQRGPESGEST